MPFQIFLFWNEFRVKLHRGLLVDRLDYGRILPCWDDLRLLMWLVIVSRDLLVLRVSFLRTILPRRDLLMLTRSSRRLHQRHINVVILRHLPVPHSTLPKALHFLLLRVQSLLKHESHFLVFRGLTLHQSQVLIEVFLLLEHLLMHSAQLIFELLLHVLYQKLTVGLLLSGRLRCLLYQQRLR